MKILKFGGSSVGSIDSIENVITLIKKSAKKDKIAVVSSAFQGVTDKLIEAAFLAKDGHESYKEMFIVISQQHISFTKKLISIKNQNKALIQVKEMLSELENLLYGIFLIRECSLSAKDHIMSFGERLSNTIIASVLKDKKINAEFCDARNLVLTDSNHGFANIDFKKTNASIKKYFRDKKEICIITGFIGSNEKGITTTLGRSGSDYTASIFGAALGVKVIEIWTDVNGILSADPRKVPEAFSLKGVSYEEAMEMAHFGAKVIYPRTMIPAAKKGIPIIVKNTFDPNNPGTTISKKSDKTNKAIKGISSIKNIAIINVLGGGMMGVPGIAKRIFGTLFRNNINVILISQASSEHSVCFAVNAQDAEKTKKVLKDEFKFEIHTDYIQKIEVLKDMTIIAVVGQSMKGSIGVSGKVFQSLAENNINIIAIAQGSSELNISFVVDKKNETKALNAIHDKFFFHKNQLHLFIVGTGVVGGKLIDQLEKQIPVLKEKGIEVIVHGIANGKKMLITAGKINLKNWRSKIQKAKTNSNLDEMILEIADFRFHNSVFVDCTGSEDIVKYYPIIFKKGISIVTPNKKGASGSYKQYKNLHDLAKENKVKYFYETNVGAGLPIIDTVRNLINSGDQIIKIEGVLSGTLSYIFGNLNSKKTFSSIVQEAQSKGFTEPDPRDDLNGIDVARKLLILAREIEYPMEMKQIKVENLTPKDCRSVKDINEFYKKLKTHDKEFSKRVITAEKKNEVLRYVASFEKGKAKAEIKTYPKNHPLANLKPTDNIIVITSERYKNNPLIVQGPGAGADVTASGVFADIIKIAHHF